MFILIGFFVSERKENLVFIQKELIKKFNLHNLYINYMQELRNTFVESNKVFKNALNEIKWKMTGK
jgi:hypothetical protein